jgi:hypothetical protein
MNDAAVFFELNVRTVRGHLRPGPQEPKDGEQHRAFGGKRETDLDGMVLEAFAEAEANTRDTSSNGPERNTSSC